MVSYALSYIGIGVLFGRVDDFVRTDAWLVVAASTMALGVLTCMGWMYLDLSSSMVNAVLYCLGTFAMSFGAACFLSLGSRFNGYVGPRMTLLVSVEGMLCAAPVMAILAVLPQPVCHIFLLLLPAMFVFCITRMYRYVPRKRLFDCRFDSSIVKPWKLLLTSALHGLPFGLVLTLLTLSRSDVTVLVFNAACFAAGALVLFFVMAFAKLDFNQLIYLAGFPIMGFGLVLIAILPTSSVAGGAVLTVGYAFVHLVMCGVNSYLVKRFAIPMPWILSWTTCCFMLGQASGALIGSLPYTFGFPPQSVSVCILFVLLVASVLLIDMRNMRYGWGAIKPSAEPAPGNLAALGCSSLAVEYGLTEREGELLVFLAAGRSKKHIANALGITEETVKSHVRSIYTKLDVHTKEGLIDMVQKRAAELGE